jgi:hypothetical protein
MIITKYSCILMLLMTMSCSSKQDKSDYRHAAILHNAMMDRARLIERDLNALHHDTLAKEVRDSFEVIANLLHAWKEDVVEVPGNDMHEHEDHSHSHAQVALEVTPQQMLEIQKELDTRLSSIGKRLALIKPKNVDPNDHRD